MAERYTKLFALTENLYQSCSPVLLAAGALLKDTQTGRVLAQLKLQSLSDKPIKAAKVYITPIDVVGNELGEAVEHQYLDLTVKRDEAFGAKSPVMLPDATTREFRAAVISVVFADNSVWEASDAAWEPLPKPVTLVEAYPDAELRKQFKLEFGEWSQCAYGEFADLCCCPCGALNRHDEAKCHTCGCDLLALRGLDIDELERRKDERLEQERIAEEQRQERMRVEAEEEAERARQVKKIAKIAIPIAVVAIAFLVVLNSVILPNVKYNNAVALMETGQYEEAFEAFEAMDGYKDSAEKIEVCAYNVAVILMESGNTIEAYEMFSDLGSYEDSTEKASELHNVYVLEKLKQGEIVDYILFGTYEQDKNKSNGKEDIEWIALDIKDGRALLITRYALDCQPYNEEGMDVTWEDCTLRNWLNEDFFNAAFSAEEQELISTTTVSADKNPYYSTWAGRDTQDEVFLLSISEANKYFSSDDERQCLSTAYAITRGAILGSSGNCAWWLRSPGYLQENAGIVNGPGHVFVMGNYVADDDNAVRPAIWVDLSE